MAKHFLLILISLFLSGFTSAETHPCVDANEQTKVIVVMSGNAYAYHKTRNCSAVKKATHKVKEVTLEEAKEMGRSPCKICY
jgi:hypothetical protein